MMRTHIFFRILLCAAVCSVCFASDVTEESDFNFTFVRQQKDTLLLTPISDAKEEVDEWPYGPYTLFMSKYGCPSDRWNRGYISFTWQTPHAMLSDTGEYDKEDEFDMQWHRLMSERTWPSHSYLYGPFSQYKMTLNFCRRPKIANKEVNNSTWSDEHTRMFGANSECPKDFHSVNHSLTLPPIVTWTGNGFLPFFRIDTEEGDKTIFTIMECLQDEPRTNNTRNTGYLFPAPNSSFILLKHEDKHCPVMDSYDVWPENIALVPLKGQSSDVSVLFQLCYYQPTLWRSDKLEVDMIYTYGDDQLYPDENDANSVIYYAPFYPDEADIESTFNDEQLYPGYYIDHVIKVCFDSEHEMAKEMCNRNEHYSYTHNMLCDEISGCWLFIDLGRTFIIKTASIKAIAAYGGHRVDISVSKRRLSIYMRPTEKEFKYSVQAENDKWSLLRYGGVEISTSGVRQPFIGRYILFKTSGVTWYELMISHFDIRLFVERTVGMCMSDLGMADGSIHRNQMSSSDGDYEKLDLVRAYNSGWCAHITDSNPYIQVDLLEDTVLDGITIHNWYTTDTNVTNGAFIKTFKPMGIRSFTFSTYSTKNSLINNMSFHVDIFRPLDEPGTFMFHKQIVAQYVRVDLIESLANGELCIKFELHGCGKYGGMTISPSLSYKETPDDTDLIARAVQTLRSPGPITNIGFPNSYRDGTTYTWIVDFRNVGFINVMFEKIRLQHFEVRTSKSSSYDCEDTFTIDTKYPCSECYWTIPSGYHSNWIIQTDVKYLVMSFTSCRPYVPRYGQDLNFIAFIEKSDTATCDGRPGYGKCNLSTMFLSTIPLVNRNAEYLPEKLTWNIVVDAFYIRLLITYFHIECSSGTFLKLVDPVSSEVVYTNCKPPSTVLQSESNRLSVIYQLGKYKSVSMINEGFEAKYNTVEFSSRIHDDIRQSGNEVWRKRNGSDVWLTTFDFESTAAPTLVSRDCSSTFKKCYYSFFGIPSSWTMADGECWVRGLKLVSIRYSEELLLVRSIVRNLRKQFGNITERQSHFDKDYPEYYSHIGLSRTTSARGGRQFVMDDGSAMIFSAWNVNEPKQEGDCVRMNFYQARNNTWEVEDCTQRNALYFVCEEHTDHLPQNDLKDSWKPSEYTGNLLYTENGRRCAIWDYLKHTEYADNDFADGTVNNAYRFCRDPNGQRNALWCYTNKDDISSWETCSVLDTILDSCRGISDPYSSTLNVTHTGTNCLRWDSPDVPKGFEILFQKGLFENYCFAFNGGYLWCFAKEQEKIVKAYCSHPDTQSHIDNDNTGYLCSNGVQISTLAVCNGIVDCVDGQDEQNCSVNIHKLMVKQQMSDGIGMLNGTHFICGSNETLSFLAYCNGIVDCVDGTDEVNCSRDKTGCSEDEFECGNGSCIHTSLMCDFIPHCIDYSDEDCDFKSCGENEKKCDNGQCIGKRQECDSHIDCLDGSDEENCDVCHGDSFHCGEKKCISNARVCDGIEDCNDGTDEKECIEKRFPTCEDRWRNGYRRNGKYSLSEEAVAECNFDTLKDDGKVTTTFYTHGRPNNTREIYIETMGTSKAGLSRFLLDYDCQQTFLQTKAFPLQTYYEFGQKYFKHIDSCSALTVNYDGQKTTQFVHDCNNVTIRLHPEKFFAMYIPDKYKLFDYERLGMKYSVGQIICRNRDVIDINEETPQMLPCDDYGEYIASVRCIYDSDSAGVILGCRSGSHLQGCSDFECPSGTVRCPGSFCLPMKYICDGLKQCPGNEDETGCCNNDDLELVLFVHDEEFVENKKIIREIADQFNHRGTIVRIVEYTVYKTKREIGEILLNVVDTAINYELVKSKEHPCKYIMRVSDFFKMIQFSNAKSRGIIFVQNGTKSHLITERIFSKMSKPDMEVFRVSLGSIKKSPEMKRSTFRYVTDITVDKFDILAKLGSKIFYTLCKDSSANLCQDNYKCSSSKLCITMDQVCDGHVHCPFSDDEMFCGFTCPPSCICSGFNVYCTHSEFVNYNNIIRVMDERLRILDISQIIEVGSIINLEQNNSVLNFPYMIKLNLSECDIVNISKTVFDKMKNLRSLDLSRNKISRIPKKTFSKLSKLVYLTLYGNEALITFDSNAFFGLRSIRHFDIAGLRIDTVSSKAFSGLELVYLNVSGSSITQIDSNAFGGVSVKTLIFESNTVKNFDERLFNGISELEHLQTSSFKYCCVRPDYLPESSCFPKADEFSSCDDLMKNSALQTMLWLMGTCALFGNIIAIVYRIVYDRERLKLGFGIFVTNLAVADFFMGVYLIIIAIADASFRKRYIFMDEYWRNSVWCTLAGVLSTISSEASVAFLCLITLDRFIVIKYPFSNLRFTPRNACIAASIAWVLAISISVTPLIAQDHFQNMFYAKSGVCVPLPLTRDRPPGWLYSVFVFIGLNFVTFICIAIGQLFMYLEINAVSSKIKNKSVGKSKARRRKELSLARNLLLVVITDFLCWFPVGCIGIMAMNGYVIPADVYAWVAAFVLPVNSALNPILYTLMTRNVRDKKQQDNAENSGRPTGMQTTLRKCDFGKQLSFFLHRENSSYRRLESVDLVLKRNMTMAPQELLKFTIQLTNCIRLLHRTSMVLENLNARDLYVTVEHGKVTGDIQIRQQPKRGASVHDRTENMYALGILVHRLMTNNNRNSSAFV